MANVHFDVSAVYNTIQKQREEKSMIIRPAQPEDREQLIGLVAQCEVTMSRFRGRAQTLDETAAEEELDRYEQPQFQVTVTEIEDVGLTGYLVCRVEGTFVWVESLYVSPIYRRQGIGSALYAEAERLAEACGSGTVYNRIHPNNDRVIAFLRARGYTVLNLLELRRPHAGETPMERINVGHNSFDCC